MKINSKKFSLLASCGLTLLMGLPPSLLASEIDSFTQRYLPLKDSAPYVNKKANEFLENAVTRANADSKGCSEKALYKEIRKDFNIILNDGTMVNYIVQDPEFPRHQIARTDSIYKYHTIWDGYLLARPAADKDGIGMGMTMNFDGKYIGSDKFEHMFGQGYHYFTRMYQLVNKMPLRRVLEQGLINERAHLGGNPLATGVYTFADLTANFQGMRFWNHILQKNEDVLGENLGPYISCDFGQWHLVKKVDFKDYVDDGFDQGINCSAVITKHGYEGVKKSLAELKEKDPYHEYKCPLDPEKLEKAKDRYRGVQIDNNLLTDYLFNPWNELTKYKLRIWWPKDENK